MLSGKYNDPMDRRTAAQQLGRRGGLKRAARLSADRKRRIAALGGNARAESFAIARRIVENLRYAATMAALQPRSVAVTRAERSDRRLPGIYVR
jgi:hypothetical protein